jgi:hypothetical protein
MVVSIAMDMDICFVLRMLLYIMEEEVFLIINTFLLNFKTSIICTSIAFLFNSKNSDDRGFYISKLGY